MPQKLIRKVQLMGGSTYVVSLPKEWAIKHGVRRGSVVELRLLPDGCLKLIPATRKLECGETVIDVGKDATKSMVSREVMARYLAGYKIIHVKFRGSRSYELAEAVKETAEKKLIGAEILSESEKEIVIRVLVNVEELPVDDIVNQMSQVAAGMLEECVRHFKQGSLEGDFRDIVSRDDLVDKLYLYGFRQLYSILRGYVCPETVGLRCESDILPYACVMSSIERVADNAAMIAYYCSRLGAGNEGQRGVRSIADYASKTVCFFRRSVEVFLERNKMEAYRLLETMPEVIGEREERLITDLGKLRPEATVELRLVLISFRSVADYSRDILETVPHLGLGAETI